MNFNWPLAAIIFAALKSVASHLIEDGHKKFKSLEQDQHNVSQGNICSIPGDKPEFYETLPPKASYGSILEAIEKLAEMLPVESFDEDKTFVQLIDSDHSQTTYVNTKDENIVYKRNSVDTNKQIVVMREHIEEKPKPVYLVLRKKMNANEPTYYAAYAYVRPAIPWSFDAFEVGGVVFTLEWDSWEDRSYRHPALWYSCKATIFLSCGFNATAFTETGRYDTFIPAIANVNEKQMESLQRLLKALKGSTNNSGELIQTSDSNAPRIENDMYSDLKTEEMSSFGRRFNSLKATPTHFHPSLFTMVPSSSQTNYQRALATGDSDQKKYTISKNPNHENSEVDENSKNPGKAANSSARRMKYPFESGTFPDFLNMGLPSLFGGRNRIPQNSQLAQLRAQNYLKYIPKSKSINITKPTLGSTTSPKPKPSSASFVRPMPKPSWISQTRPSISKPKSIDHSVFEMQVDKWKQLAQKATEDIICTVVGGSLSAGCKQPEPSKKHSSNTIQNHLTVIDRPMHPNFQNAFQKTQNHCPSSLRCIPAVFADDNSEYSSVAGWFVPGKKGFPGQFMPANRFALKNFLPGSPPLPGKISTRDSAEPNFGLFSEHGFLLRPKANKHPYFIKDSDGVQADFYEKGTTKPLSGILCPGVFSVPNIFYHVTGYLAENSIQYGIMKIKADAQLLEAESDGFILTRSSRDMPYKFISEAAGKSADFSPNNFSLTSLSGIFVAGVKGSPDLFFVDPATESHLISATEGIMQMEESDAMEVTVTPTSDLLTYQVISNRTEGLSATYMPDISLAVGMIAGSFDANSSYFSPYNVSKMPFMKTTGSLTVKTSMHGTMSPSGSRNLPYLFTQDPKPQPALLILSEGNGKNRGFRGKYYPGVHRDDTGKFKFDHLTDEWKAKRYSTSKAVVMPKDAALTPIPVKFQAIPMEVATWSIQPQANIPATFVADSIDLPVPGLAIDMFDSTFYFKATTPDDINPKSASKSGTIQSADNSIPWSHGALKPIAAGVGVFTPDDTLTIKATYYPDSSLPVSGTAKPEGFKYEFVAFNSIIIQPNAAATNGLLKLTTGNQGELKLRGTMSSTKTTGKGIFDPLIGSAIKATWYPDGSNPIPGRAKEEAEKITFVAQNPEDLTSKTVVKGTMSVGKDEALRGTMQGTKDYGVGIFILEKDNSQKALFIPHDSQIKVPGTVRKNPDGSYSFNPKKWGSLKDGIFAGTLKFGQSTEIGEMEIVSGKGSFRSNVGEAENAVFYPDGKFPIPGKVNTAKDLVYFKSFVIGSINFGQYPMAGILKTETTNTKQLGVLAPFERGMGIFCPANSASVPSTFQPEDGSRSITGVTITFEKWQKRFKPLIQNFSNKKSSIKGTLHIFPEGEIVKKEAGILQPQKDGSAIFSPEPAIMDTAIFSKDGSDPIPGAATLNADGTKIFSADNPYRLPEDRTEIGYFKTDFSDTSIIGAMISREKAGIGIFIPQLITAKTVTFYPDSGSSPKLGKMFIYSDTEIFFADRPSTLPHFQSTPGTINIAGESPSVTSIQHGTLVTINKGQGFFKQDKADLENALFYPQGSAPISGIAQRRLDGKISFTVYDPQLLTPNNPPKQGTLKISETKVEEQGTLHSTNRLAEGVFISANQNKKSVTFIPDDGSVHIPGSVTPDFDNTYEFIPYVARLLTSMQNVKKGILKFEKNKKEHGTLQNIEFHKGRFIPDSAESVEATFMIDEKKQILGTAIPQHDGTTKFILYDYKALKQKFHPIPGTLKLIKKNVQIRGVLSDYKSQGLAIFTPEQSKAKSATFFPDEGFDSISGIVVFRRDHVSFKAYYAESIPAGTDLVKGTLKWVKDNNESGLKRGELTVTSEGMAIFKEDTLDMSESIFYPDGMPPLTGTTRTDKGVTIFIVKSSKSMLPGALDRSGVLVTNVNTQNSLEERGNMKSTMRADEGKFTPVHQPGFRVTFYPDDPTKLPKSGMAEFKNEIVYFTSNNPAAISALLPPLKGTLQIPKGESMYGSLVPIKEGLGKFKKMNLGSTIFYSDSGNPPIPGVLDDNNVFEANNPLAIKVDSDAMKGTMQGISSEKSSMHGILTPTKQGVGHFEEKKQANATIYIDGDDPRLIFHGYYSSEQRDQRSKFTFEHREEWERIPKYSSSAYVSIRMYSTYKNKTLHGTYQYEDVEKAKSSFFLSEDSPKPASFTPTISGKLKEIVAGTFYHNPNIQKKDFKSVFTVVNPTSRLRAHDHIPGSIALDVYKNRPLRGVLFNPIPIPTGDKGVFSFTYYLQTPIFAEWQLENQDAKGKLTYYPSIEGKGAQVEMKPEDLKSIKNNDRVFLIARKANEKELGLILHGHFNVPGVDSLMALTESKSTNSEFVPSNKNTNVTLSGKFFYNPKIDAYVVVSKSPNKLFLEAVEMVPGKLMRMEEVPLAGMLKPPKNVSILPTGMYVFEFVPDVNTQAIIYIESNPNYPIKGILSTQNVNTTAKFKVKVKTDITRVYEEIGVVLVAKGKKQTGVLKQVAGDQCVFVPAEFETGLKPTPIKELSDLPSLNATAKPVPIEGAELTTEDQIKIFIPLTGATGTIILNGLGPLDPNAVSLHGILKPPLPKSKVASCTFMADPEQTNMVDSKKPIANVDFYVDGMTSSPVKGFISVQGTVTKVVYTFKASITISFKKWESSSSNGCFNYNNRGALIPFNPKIIVEYQRSLANVPTPTDGAFFAGEKGLLFFPKSGTKVEVTLRGRDKLYGIFKPRKKDEAASEFLVSDARISGMMKKYNRELDCTVRSVEEFIPDTGSDHFPATFSVRNDRMAFIKELSSIQYGRFTPEKPVIPHLIAYCYGSVAKRYRVTEKVETQVSIEHENRTNVQNDITTVFDVPSVGVGKAFNALGRSFDSNESKDSMGTFTRLNYEYETEFREDTGNNKEVIQSGRRSALNKILGIKDEEYSTEESTLQNVDEGGVARNGMYFETEESNGFFVAEEESKLGTFVNRRLKISISVYLKPDKIQPDLAYLTPSSSKDLKKMTSRKSLQGYFLPIGALSSEYGIYGRLDTSMVDGKYLFKLSIQARIGEFWVDDEENVVKKPEAPEKAEATFSVLSSRSRHVPGLLYFCSSSYIFMPEGEVRAGYFAFGSPNPITILVEFTVSPIQTNKGLFRMVSPQDLKMVSPGDHEGLFISVQYSGANYGIPGIMSIPESMTYTTDITFTLESFGLSVTAQPEDLMAAPDTIITIVNGSKTLSSQEAQNMTDTKLGYFFHTPKAGFFIPENSGKYGSLKSDWLGEIKGTLYPVPNRNHFIAFVPLEPIKKSSGSRKALKGTFTPEEFLAYPFAHRYSIDVTFTPRKGVVLGLNTKLDVTLSHYKLFYYTQMKFQEIAGVSPRQEMRLSARLGPIQLPKIQRFPNSLNGYMMITKKRLIFFKKHEAKEGHFLIPQGSDYILIFSSLMPSVTSRNEAELEFLNPEPLKKLKKDKASGFFVPLEYNSLDLGIEGTFKTADVIDNTVTLRLRHKVFGGYFKYGNEKRTERVGVPPRKSYKLLEKLNQELHNNLFQNHTLSFGSRLKLQDFHLKNMGTKLTGLKFGISYNYSAGSIFVEMNRGKAGVFVSEDETISFNCILYPIIGKLAEARLISQSHGSDISIVGTVFGYFVPEEYKLRRFGMKVAVTGGDSFSLLCKTEVPGERVWFTETTSPRLNFRSFKIPPPKLIKAGEKPPVPGQKIKQEMMKKAKYGLLFENNIGGFFVEVDRGEYGLLIFNTGSEDRTIEAVIYAGRTNSSVKIVILDSNDLNIALNFLQEDTEVTFLPEEYSEPKYGIVGVIDYKSSTRSTLKMNLKNPARLGWYLVENSIKMHEAPTLIPLPPQKALPKEQEIPEGATFGYLFHLQSGSEWFVRKNTRRAGIFVPFTHKDLELVVELEVIAKTKGLIYVSDFHQFSVLKTGKQRGIFIPDKYIKERRYFEIIVQLPLARKTKGLRSLEASFWANIEAGYFQYESFESSQKTLSSLRHFPSISSQQSSLYRFSAPFRKFKSLANQINLPFMKGMFNNTWFSSMRFPTFSSLPTVRPSTFEEFRLPTSIFKSPFLSTPSAHSASLPHKSKYAPEFLTSHPILPQSPVYSSSRNNNSLRLPHLHIGLTHFPNSSIQDGTLSSSTVTMPPSTISSAVVQVSLPPSQTSKPSMSKEDLSNQAGSKPPKVIQATVVPPLASTPSVPSASESPISSFGVHSPGASKGFLFDTNAGILYILQYQSSFGVLVLEGDESLTFEVEFRPLSEDVRHVELTFLVARSIGIIRKRYTGRIKGTFLTLKFYKLEYGINMFIESGLLKRTFVAELESSTRIEYPALDYIPITSDFSSIDSKYSFNFSEWSRKEHYPVKAEKVNSSTGNNDSVSSFGIFYPNKQNGLFIPEHLGKPGQLYVRQVHFAFDVVMFPKPLDSSSAFIVPRRVDDITAALFPGVFNALFIPGEYFMGAFDTMAKKFFFKNGILMNFEFEMEAKSIIVVKLKKPGNFGSYVLSEAVINTEANLVAKVKPKEPDTTISMRKYGIYYQMTKVEGMFVEQNGFKTGFFETDDFSVQVKFYPAPFKRNEATLVLNSKADKKYFTDELTPGEFIPVDGSQETFLPGVVEAAEENSVGSSYNMRLGMTGSMGYFYIEELMAPVRPILAVVAGGMSDAPPDTDYGIFYNGTRAGFFVKETETKHGEIFIGHKSMPASLFPVPAQTHLAEVQLVREPPASYGIGTGESNCVFVPEEYTALGASLGMPGKLIVISPQSKSTVLTLEKPGIYGYFRVVRKAVGEDLEETKRPREIVEGYRYEAKKGSIIVPQIGMTGVLNIEDDPQRFFVTFFPVDKRKCVVVFGDTSAISDLLDETDQLSAQFTPSGQTAKIPGTLKILKIKNDGTIPNNMISFITSIDATKGHFEMKTEYKKYLSKKYVQTATKNITSSTKLRMEEIIEGEGIHGTYYTDGSGKKKFIPDDGTQGYLLLDDRTKAEVEGSFYPATKPLEQLATFVPLQQNILRLQSLLKSADDIPGSFLPKESKDAAGIEGMWNIAGDEAIFLPARRALTGTLYTGDKKNVTEIESHENLYKTEKNFTQIKQSSEKGVFKSYDVTTTTSYEFNEQQYQGAAYTSISNAQVFLPSTGTVGSIVEANENSDFSIEGVLFNQGDGSVASFVTSSMNKLISFCKRKQNDLVLFVPKEAARESGIEGAITIDEFASSAIFIPTIKATPGCMERSKNNGERDDIVMYKPQMDMYDIKIGVQGSKVHGVYYEGKPGSYISDFPPTRGKFVPLKSGSPIPGIFYPRKHSSPNIFMPGRTDELSQVLNTEDAELKGSFYPVEDRSVGRNDGNFIKGSLKKGPNPFSFIFNPLILGVNGWLTIKVVPQKMMGRAFSVKKDLAELSFEDDDAPDIWQNPGWKTQYQELDSNITLRYESDVFYGFGNCPRSHYKIPLIGSDNDLNHMLGYFLGLLRTHCINRELDYIRSLFEEEYLVQENDTFIIPEDSKYLLASKLTGSQSEKLSVAVELSAFTLVHHDRLQPGTSCDEASSVSKLSQSVVFFKDVMLKSLELSITKGNAHFISLSRNIVKTVFTATTKLYQDRINLNSCEVCEVDKVINKNDIRLMLTLSNFIMSGLEGLPSSHRDIYSFFKSYYFHNVDLLPADL